MERHALTLEPAPEAEREVVGDARRRRGRRRERRRDRHRPRGRRVRPPGAPPVGVADYLPTPTLADLDWMVLMPEKSVGIATIPAGAKPGQSGVMVGGRPFRAGIHHYTKDGLLIGEFHSDEARFGGQTDAWKNWPTGLIDVMGGVNVNRDPRD